MHPITDRFMNIINAARDSWPAEVETPTETDLTAASAGFAAIRRAVDAAEEAVADALPPVSIATLAAAQDSTLAREVERWRAVQGYDLVDITDLDEDEDGDTWEIVNGSSRYEVREVPRYEAAVYTNKAKTGAYWYVSDQADDGDEVTVDADALAVCGIDPENDDRDEAAVRRIAAHLNDRDGTIYVIFDTDTGGRADRDDFENAGADRHYDREDESEADEAAAAMNREDYRNNANGWPFAHNYAAPIRQYDVADFAAAGFVVATYKGDTLYAGVDGGGYSFMDAHWIPLYLRRAARNGWRVQTSAGLRRVSE